MTSTMTHVADPQVRGDHRTAARRLLSAAIAFFGGLPRTEYRSIVTEVVVDLADQVPEEQVYPMSLGAFPTVVKDTLGTLDRSGRVACRSAGEPLPNPADIAPWEYDELDPVNAKWYFDVPSVREIMSHFPPGKRDSLVALGAPTVAAMAAETVPQVTLIDISPRFFRGETPKWLDTDKVERIQFDLDEKVYSGIQADVVVMDPPWYIENYRAWLKSAAALCREGGLIAMPLPQLLTNRRSLPEREEIMALLRFIGHVTVKDDALTYVTPSFEASVLKSSGLGFLTRWRRADLALVTVRERRLPYEFRRFGGSDWNYREIYGQVVRTWGEKQPRGVLPFIEEADASPDYRLTAVGRNYISSSNANLITSRGRAATVHTWGALPRILDLAEDGVPLEIAVSRALPRESAPERERLVATLRTIFDFQLPEEWDDRQMETGNVGR